VPHFPGHLRSAFCDAVKDWPIALLDDDVLYFSDRRMAQWWETLTAEQRGRWLAGQMMHCSDVMPSFLCERLDLPQGSTYSQEARSLLDSLHHVKMPRKPSGARPSVNENDRAWVLRNAADEALETAPLSGPR
jgi:hypothetical protein